MLKQFLCAYLVYIFDESEFWETLRYIFQACASVTCFPNAHIKRHTVVDVCDPRAGR